MVVEPPQSAQEPQPAKTCFEHSLTRPSGVLAHSPQTPSIHSLFCNKSMPGGQPILAFQLDHRQ